MEGLVSKETHEYSKAFRDIGMIHTLNAFSKKESLAVTEVECFKTLLRWTDNQRKLMTLL